MGVSQRGSLSEIEGVSADAPVKTTWGAPLLHPRDGRLVVPEQILELFGDVLGGRKWSDAIEPPLPKVHNQQLSWVGCVAFVI